MPPITTLASDARTHLETRPDCRHADPERSHESNPWLRNVSPDGNVAAGPPQHPLPRYEVRVEKGQVQVQAAPIPIQTAIS